MPNLPYRSCEKGCLNGREPDMRLLIQARWTCRHCAAFRQRPVSDGPLSSISAPLRYRYREWFSILSKPADVVSVHAIIPVKKGIGWTAARLPHIVRDRLTFVFDSGRNVLPPVALNSDDIQSR